MSIKQFFSPSRVYTVVGASNNEGKFGYKVFDWYLNHELPTIPINPSSPSIKSIPTSKTIIDALELIKKEYPSNDGVSISFITPPSVSLDVLERIGSEGLSGMIKGVWFQPGSYDSLVLNKSKDLGIENIIAKGACILVQGDSGYVDSTLKANL